ncbi:MAG TPA: transporter [Thermoanaerobaculia bacterium]|nr:transporter [Thermoanaerobaculia bacterium]
MQQHSKRRAMLFGLVMLMAFPVFAEDVINADRPGIADGSQVVNAGTLQVELGAERDSNPDLLTTPLLLRYGLTRQLELRVETAGFAHIGGHDGVAPLSLGAKFHFLDAPSLGLIARLFPPSGSGIFRSHETDADLRLAADKDLSDRWSVEGNLGIAREDRDNHALAAATLQYNVTPKMNVFVDAGLETAPSSLTIDAGAAWIIGKDLQLDVSAGWGAHGDTPDRFIAAGISRRF